MFEANSIEQRANQSATAVVWSISFGDLLTLLVCFFLVLTPWDKLKSAVKVSQNQHVNVLPFSSDALGINFAPSVMSVTAMSDKNNQLLRRAEVGIRDASLTIRAEVPIFVHQVAQPSLAGFEELSASIKRDMPEALSLGSSVVLRVCSNDIEVDEVVSLVGRQLMNVGVEERQLVISYPTASCESVVTMKPVTKPLVGSITVIRKHV